MKPCSWTGAATPANLAKNSTTEQRALKNVNNGALSANE
jgi:hypothetical protein